MGTAGHYLQAFYESPLFIVTSVVIWILTMKTLARFGVLRAPVDLLAHRRNKRNLGTAVLFILGLIVALEGEWEFTLMFFCLAGLSFWGQRGPRFP